MSDATDSRPSADTMSSTLHSAGDPTASAAGESVAEARGTLFAVGLGPGHPGLVTVRATEILGSVGVVAYPVDAAGEPGRAYRIARPYLRDGVAELPLRMPMTSDRAALHAAWDEAIRAINRETVAGHDVAYLCLGDVLLYGSFGYLLARYEGPVETVPGVISPVAAASLLGEPLVEGREPLVVVPDGGNIELLRGALALGGTVVIMKPSRLSSAAVDLLKSAGALQRAWVTADISMDSERVFAPRSAEELRKLPYFSIVTILPLGREAHDRPEVETK